MSTQLGAAPASAPSTAARLPLGLVAQPRVAGLQVVEPAVQASALAQRVRLAQHGERLPDPPVVLLVILRGLAPTSGRQLEARSEEDLAPAVKIVDVAREPRSRREAPPRVVVRLLDDRFQDVAQRRDGVAVGVARARRQRPQRASTLATPRRQPATPALLRAVVGLGRAARVPARRAARASSAAAPAPRRDAAAAARSAASRPTAPPRCAPAAARSLAPRRARAAQPRRPRPARAPPPRRRRRRPARPRPPRPCGASPGGRARRRPWRASSRRSAASGPCARGRPRAPPRPPPRPRGGRGASSPRGRRRRRRVPGPGAPSGASRGKVGSVTSSVASSFAANLSAVRRGSPSAQRRRMASAAARRAVAESLLSVAAAVCGVSLASSRAALNLRNSVILVSLRCSGFVFVGLYAAFYKVRLSAANQWTVAAAGVLR